MKTPDEGESAQQALRLAQLEIKMLREQLRKAMEEATSARGGAQKTRPAPPPPIVLPRPAPVSVPGKSAAKARRPSAEGRRVLCIEDSEANFRLIETILSDRPGTDLAWAESGRQGLDMALERRPQLILLDLDLPDMHGSEVLAKLRTESSTAGTPVIVISADATPSQIERMLEAGARDYITKPFEIRRFLLMFDDIFVEELNR